MALTKEVVVSQLEVTALNVVMVRMSTRIKEDGVQISESYHRKSIAPGEDYSLENAQVQAVCAAVHTPETIAAYQAHMAG